MVERVDLIKCFVALSATAFIAILFCLAFFPLLFYDIGFYASMYLIFAIVFIGGTFHYSRVWAKTDTLIYKIARQPIIPVKYCTPGTVAQVYGKIKSVDGKLLVSPLEKKPCVFYHYIKEEYRQHGKSGSWVVVENKACYVPFKVVDNSGEILINLRNVDSDLSGYAVEEALRDKYPDYDNSEIDAVKLCYRKRLLGPKIFGIRVYSNVRVSEYILPEGIDVFVNGYVFEEDGKKYLAEHASTPLIISRKKKEAYLEDFAKGDNFFYTSNFLLMLGLVALFLFAHYSIGLPLSLLFIPLLLVLARMVYGTYNRMVELQNRCKNALHQISIELKKRNNLIPMLANVVKGYANYEQLVLKRLTALRTTKKLGILEQIREYDQKEKELVKLIAKVEQYPKLKASKLFLEFATRLAVIEKNIAYFRSFYNKTVLKYNTFIELFPFVIVAKAFGFKKMEYLKLR